MKNDDSQEYYAERMAEQQGDLAEKKQEMKECLKELGRKFSYLKTKIKKYEKIILTLDEERDKTSVMVASSCVQLALNKFREIEIKIGGSSEQKNYFEKGCRELTLYATQEALLAEKVAIILVHYRNFKFKIKEAENTLRIANKHLKKADDFFKFKRSLRR